MIRWCLVFIQYVALCGAATTQTPSLWGGMDPFFGSSWWNEPSPGTAGQAAQTPITNPFLAPVNPPLNLLVEPVVTPASTKPPSYDTATPVQVTKPAGRRGPTEPSISLHDLIRLAVGGMGMGQEVKGASSAFSNVFSSLSKSSSASVADSNLKPDKPETTTSKATKPVQKLVTTAPAMNVKVEPATHSAVVPVTKTTYAPTTTTKATTTNTTPKPKPTTTTPTTTTTTTTTTTPKPTTTTTTTPKPTTTTPRFALTTNKPIVKMTLGEILRLQSMMNAEANQVTVKTSGKPRGCYHKGTFYKPLSEIEKGQTGNWCYGSYCNHAGTVVHWDDHKCSTTPTKPPTTTTSAPTFPPVTQPTVTNPVQPGGMAGMSNFMNMAQMSGMTGMAGMGNMANMARMAAMLGGNAGSMGTAGTGTSGGNSNSGFGCYYNGQWYAPGADIENLRDYGRCYGRYCNSNSEIVSWNDRCTATIPPPAAGGSMGQMGMGGQMAYMDQIGTGGQGGMGGESLGMSQMGGTGGMGGGGMDMALVQMALGGEGLNLGGGGGGTGTGTGMSQMGGMGGMGGEGGMGMGGQAGMGMGRQTQGGLSMRQLQQLDLI